MTTATRRKRTRKDRIEGRWRRYLETRDPKIRNELIEIYLPLVRAIAAKLASRLPRFVDTEDLSSSGVVGLVAAIEHFEPERRVKFEIYAKKRIAGAMIDDLRRQDTLPRDARERAEHLRRTVRKLRDDLGREPTPYEIAESMGFSLAAYREVMLDLAFCAQVSLDPHVGDPENADPRRTRFEPIDVRPQPHEIAHRHELMNLVDRELDARERTIVREFYEEEHTLKHIGASLRLSESRICQLHTELISRLRQHLYKEAAP